MLSPGAPSYQRSIRRASRQPSSDRLPSIVIGPVARVIAYVSPLATACAAAGAAAATIAAIAAAPNNRRADIACLRRDIAVRGLTPEMVRWMTVSANGGGSVRRALLVSTWVLLVAGGGTKALAQTSPTAPQARPLAPAFLGSVPSGQATAEPLPLTILDAINRALEHNLGILLAGDARGRAEGARWRAMGGDRKST